MNQRGKDFPKKHGAANACLSAANVLYFFRRAGLTERAICGETRFTRRLTKEKEYRIMEYKIVSFQTWVPAEGAEDISIMSQRASVCENPAVDQKLAEYQKEGWRPISPSNSSSGFLFVLMGREKN